MAGGPAARLLGRPATRAGFTQVMWVGAVWAVLGMLAGSVSAAFSFGGPPGSVLISGLATLYTSVYLTLVAYNTAGSEICDIFLLRKFFVLMQIPLVMLLISAFLYEDLFVKTMVSLVTVPLWLLITKHLSDRGHALFGVR